jgi:hypothetical protein
MSAPPVKTWKLDSGTYMSPPYPDLPSFSRAKIFFIRAGIFADCNEANRIIKVPITGPHASQNKFKLKQLNMID